MLFRNLKKKQEVENITSRLLFSTGHLIIEPGVEVRFMPEAGLTVWGILTAEGLPDSKIRFLPAEQVDLIQPNRTIRLVDGPSINEGIVQVEQTYSCSFYL